MLKRLFRKANEKKSLDLISNQIDQVILLTDEHGYISYASNSISEILGYSSKELIGKPLSDIIYQENTPSLKNFFETCHKQTHCRHKYWFLLKDKSYSQFFLESKHIPEESKIIHVINRPEKYHQSETHLALDDRRHKFLMNNMNDCILIINKKGTITYASGVKEMFGHEEEIIGSSAFIPVHPDDKQKTLDFLNEFKETNRLPYSRQDYRVLNSRGEYMWVEGNFKVIQDIYTGEYQILNNIRDITERKRMEKELKEANKTKDKLFSIIAHDLKNPISNLTGFAQLLVTDYHNESEEEIKNSINRIYESSKLINELMENLLNWSRTQYKRITSEPEPLNLKEIFDQSLSHFKERLINKEIALNTDFDEESLVFADKNMLYSIFRNLLSNAIKFSPSQSSIQVGSQSEDSSREVIYVENQGRGLTEEEQNQVLDDNQFISTHGTENEKGLGLGLKIIKEFVKKNNGEIWFENNRKTGTKVCVRLPKA